MVERTCGARKDVRFGYEGGPAADVSR